MQGKPARPLKTSPEAGAGKRQTRPWRFLGIFSLNISMCRLILLVFGIMFSGPLLAITGVTGQSYGRTELSDSPSHRGKVSESPSRTHKPIDVLDIIRLAQSPGEIARENTVAQPTTRLSEKIKKAGELLHEGDRVRAKEMIREGIRGCQGSAGDLRDCADWLRALRGLDTALTGSGERIVLTNSIGMEMVRIPAGDYMMGSLRQEMDWLRLTFKSTWRDGHKQWFQDELPLHPVRITKPFYMGATEVTVGQFREFVRSTNHKTDAEKEDGGMIWSNKEYRWTPRKNMAWNSVPWRISDDQPVVFVSWNDAQAFCRWLSRKEKRTYRLPTEAEWEMACRGGAAWVRFPWGNRLPGDRDTNFGDGYPKLPESLTTVNDGYEFVSPVGSYPPNAYGLYDMGGNVMEWVQDFYGRNYYEGSPLEDPMGPDIGTSRVNKGGNWFASPADGRCAFRGFSGPEMSFWNLGFRVVMEEKEDEGTLSAKTEDGVHSARAESRGSAELPPTTEDGLSLFRQAMFAAQQQQWDDATRDLEEALKIYEERQDHMWTARVKATLAGVYAERGRRYKSKELYTQALAEFRKIGDTAAARILLARLRELETSPGVRVVKIRKGGIADKAGIVEGDTIIEYAGETGFRVAGFKKIVEDFAHADQVTLSIFNNDQITTTVVPGGELGVALEDIKRPRRPAPPPDQRRPPPRGRGRPAGNR
ncbi:MAG: SUMF1/EgtB/PvdO family nonheme iron enzyme [Desulfomonilaceae bacterium]|nr:SUMF1/EgtB/PvdO family nonheme iron enzyme [Desulfomonilaceae bacterium]